MKKRGLQTTKNNPLLGTRLYNGFMKRYSDLLRRGRLRHKEVKRSSWCTKEHFKNMYDAIYEKMVEANVAKKLDEEVMLDIDGNIVDDETKMYGRKTRYILTKPEMVLFVDETGCNTNQKDGSQVGGRCFVVPRDDTEPGLVGCTSDIHFTVLCFTSATGHPVMCAIIVKSTKESCKLPIRWTEGIDIRKNPIDGSTTVEILERNCGEDGAMSGGPTCLYNGKTVPAFICSSPNASITSQLLADMLARLDHVSLALFDRSIGWNGSVSSFGWTSQQIPTSISVVYKRRQ